MVDPSDGVYTVEDLQPLLRNPRRHTERNINMITRSVNEFGVGRGIVVDENFEVLAGNGLLDAAINAGVEGVQVVRTNGEELVVVQVSHLTEEQKRRYAVADNRTAELSGWDASELRKIVSDGIDLSMFFTTEEQDEILTTTSYTPTLEPVAMWDEVTPEWMESEYEVAEHRYEPPRANIVEHVCPNCGKTVYLRK